MNASDIRHYAKLFQLLTEAIGKLLIAFTLAFAKLFIDFIEVDAAGLKSIFSMYPVKGLVAPASCPDVP